MMSRSIVVEPITISSWRRACRQAADYLALTKPRVVLMVLITTSVGFYLGSPGHLHWLMLLHTLVGVALANDGSFGQAAPRDTIAGKCMIGMPQDGDLVTHTGPAQQPVEM
jgi:hypothetical protein